MISLILKEETKQEHDKTEESLQSNKIFDKSYTLENYKNLLIHNYFLVSKYEPQVNKFLHKYRCWALLESCSHFTCLPCMRKWRKVSHSCPLCRIVSNRYLWSYYSQIPDENRKKCLFDRRDYHVIEDEPPAPPESEGLDDIEVIYRYEDDGTILYLEEPDDDDFF